MNETYREFIPDFDKFIKAMSTPAPKGIRPNHLKITTNQLEQWLKSNKYEYTKPFEFLDYFFIQDEKIVHTLEYQLGHFYIQGASSLIPVEELAPLPGEKVLDMCAAPGGKTTHMAMKMKNTGCLIANEPFTNRAIALKANLDRLGVINTAVTNYRGENFPNIMFDKILLDGPCSAEGSQRGNNFTWEDDEKFRNHLENIQRKLILKAFDLLKPGGDLVYSTCTFSPRENEKIVEYLIDQRKKSKLKTCKHINRFSPGLDSENKTIRIYPHLFNSGGFYVARISKSK